MAIENRKPQIESAHLGVLGELGGLFSLLFFLGGFAAAGEMIYLQDGKEYYGSLQAITAGQVRAQIGGKDQTFPLDQIQRVEFQRSREFDNVATAADLAKAAPLFAQALKPTTEELAKKFPQAAYVVLADEVAITLGDDSRYVLERTQAWRLLQERGSDSAAQALFYFPDRQKVAVVFGLTVGPDGSVTRVADTAMKDEAIYARLPAYNFRHRLRFNLKNAVPGATFFLKTRLEGRGTLADPLILDGVFWGTEPALAHAVRLVASPKTRPTAAFAAANGLQPAGDGVWEVKDAPQVFTEPLMPPLAAFAPRFVLAWPKATWVEIAKDFLQRVGSPACRPMQGKSPRELFDAVRLEIRAESVPLDALPDAPARPAKVLDRRYGNAVERALLLTALLRGEGAKAETLLVRDRDEGPLVPEVPRLRNFDHALVRLTDKDSRVTWLQPDDDLRGFGELAPDVQGCQGLNLDSGEIETVPILEPANESIQRTVEVQVAPDGSAEVRDTQVDRGRFAHGLRELKGLSDSELEKWATRFVGSQAAGVALLDFKHSDFSRADPEETLSFTYRIPALAEKSGPYLILRLPNATLSLSDVGRSTRERDLHWAGRELMEASFVVRAPAGYGVYAVPESFEQKGAGWSVAARFAADTAARGVARFNDRWERTALGAPRDAYAAYREARIKRARLREETLVFVKE